MASWRLLAHGRHSQLDQVRRAREIRGGQRMADRIGRRTMLLIPRARAPMQRRDLIGLLRQQMRSEHVGKEVMIAIPVALIIQRHDKEVAALQGIQQRLPSCWPVTASHSGPLKRSRMAVWSKKLRTRFGLTLQDLVDQIVHDVAVVAGESPDEPGNVLVALHRERGQLQAGNPAFGARFQGGDVLRREVEAHHLVEKAGGFGGGKAQVGGAQFGQLVAGA